MKPFLVFLVMASLLVPAILPAQEETMLYALYIAPRIGDGTPRNAYRSKVCNYVRGNPPDGQNYWDWLHRARPIRFGVVYADAAIHDQLDADGEIKAVSPRLDSLTSMASWLNAAYGEMEAAHRAPFESNGCSLGWLTDVTPKRDLFRYFAKIHILAGDVYRLNDPEALSFFVQNLGTTVAQIPVGVRTKVKTWMENKGLSTSWITNQTTVRQIIQYVIEGLTLPTMAVGPVEF